MATMNNKEKKKLEDVLAGIADEGIKDKIRKEVVSNFSKVDDDTVDDEAKTSEHGGPKWSLKKNFIRDNLDINSMKGEKFRTWLRQFKGFLREGKFRQSNVTDQQRIDALEQCVTSTTFDQINGLKLSLPSDDRDDIDKILDLIEKVCLGEAHIWSKRKLFFNRTHQKGEPVSDYVLELRKRASHCNFGEHFCQNCKLVANEQFILHQVVFGINKDLELQAEILKKDKLNVEDAISIATKYETIREAQLTLNNEDRAQTLMFNSHMYGESVENQSDYYGNQVNFFQPEKGMSASFRCFNCNLEGHKANDEKCPARNATCQACNRKGHWKITCRSTNFRGRGQNRQNQGFRGYSRGRGRRGVMAMTYQEPQEYSRNRQFHFGAGTYGFTGALINVFSTSTRKCTINVTTGKGVADVMGIVDTGSDWNAAGPQHFHSFRLTADDLHSPTVAMMQTLNASGQTVRCLGYIEAKFQWSGNETVGNLVFFTDFPNILWSLETVQALKIVTIHADEVKTKSPDESIVSGDFYGASTKLLRQCLPPELSTGGVVPTRAQLIDKYKDVFEPRDEPMNGEPLKITITPDAVPTRVSAARSVPLSLKEPITRELFNLRDHGLIQPVTKPTDWCSPIVAVPKPNKAEIPNDDWRIVVDFRNLNKYVLREYFQSSPPLEAIQSIPAEEAEYFSSFDCWKGFHQQRLHPESIDFTTFIMPFNLGRWQYVRAPFGISNVSEIYDRQLTELLAGLDNHRRIVDDNLLFSKDPEYHAYIVEQFLQKCREKRIRLSESKFVYMQKQVDWAGYTVSNKGYSIQDKVTESIRNFPEPKTRTDLRSFQGMANQLAPMNKELTKALTPLRDLLKRDTEFLFDEVHRQNFIEAKRILVSPAVMAYFRLGSPLHLFTDASTLNGLGFVLKQKQLDGSWRPIQVGSRALADAERRYAPIELELLAVVFALKKARTFLAGSNHFTVFTDQKPLVTILNKRRIDEIPNQRLLKLVMRTMDYNFTVEHVSGSQNLIADALSRYPTGQPSDNDIEMCNENRQYCKKVCAVHAQTAEISPRLERVKIFADDDVQYQSLMQQIVQGFPDHKHELADDLKEYWQVRSELSVSDDGFILYGTRLLIPRKQRREILDELHGGHRGIDGIRERARLVVYWPGIDGHIAQDCDHCEQCFQDRPSLQKEPLIKLPTPERAFEMVSTDLFEVNGKKGLVYTDCYTGWFSWCYPMPHTDAGAVIPVIRKFIRDTAVPDILFSDRGPPYNSKEFDDFLKRWGIGKSPSSAYYPQGNSRAELAVKNCTSLIEKYYKGSHTDWDSFDRALMQVRNTPHKSNGLSPAMMLYGHPVQDGIPAHKSMFTKDWHQRFVDADRKYAENRDRIVNAYNRGSRELPPLKVGTLVAVQNVKTKRWDKYGVIQEAKPSIRSYLIRLASGMIISRNRRFIRVRIPAKEHMPPIRTLEPLVPESNATSGVKPHTLGPVVDSDRNGDVDINLPLDINNAQIAHDYAQNAHDYAQNAHGHDYAQNTGRPLDPVLPERPGRKKRPPARYPAPEYAERLK